MNLKDLQIRLTNNFPAEPTADQNQFFIGFSDFIFRGENRGIMVLKGYAGTGKTTLMKSIVLTMKNLGVMTMLMAPTGRAAKVLMSATKHPATTIHKAIYRLEVFGNGGFKYSVVQKKLSDVLIIVDEASMIPSGGKSLNEIDLLGDLMSFMSMGENVKLLLIGDHAQLPPVGFDHSPALDEKHCTEYSKIKTNSVELKTVLRQKLDSGILANATALRMYMSSGKLDFPWLSDQYPDVVRVLGTELQDHLEQAMSEHGEDEVIVVTRSNKSANLFNQAFRHRVKWMDGRIGAGDRIMCVKNNYFWLEKTETPGFIANGDMMEILELRNECSLYGFDFADLSVRMLDYPHKEPMEIKVMLDVLESPGPSLGKGKLKELYDQISMDYPEVTAIRQKDALIRETPWYNAVQIKFAYAVTCHKAQGGQWKSVFVDQGYLNDEMINIEYQRWLYTAITRASEKVYLVNFHNRFFKT